MSPPPTTSLPPLRRAFEPARYSQHYLACVYLQVVSTRRRGVSALPNPVQAAPAAKAATAS
jgi:hypothetical protein